ncbi:60S ribosomal protein L23a-like [Neomonachus schauinslandi]|uniref:60S ribosomal protein L23a-like n=1 Tax=Neomonachus schauinslandi TaxID=29088 RepID=A0A8M1M5J7_NEOSC|nr:60S ribosomal protein L23a-like [Neomonachus schauinslandi]
MVPKAKKEAPATPKAKAKTVKAKKAVLKSVHSHKKKKRRRRRSTHHPYSNGPRHCISKGSPNVLERVPPGETSLTTMPSSSSSSPTTESAMKKIEDSNTLVFIVDIKANKY